MIRKFVLPALATALLAGCVTDYAYRGGDRGDYYYGRPSVEYRYDGYGGYGPYGYPGYYGGGGYGYPHGYYGVPFGYGGYYNYPYPYYRPYYRRPHVVHPHPRPDGAVPGQQGEDRRPPWRNYDGLRRRQSADGSGIIRPAPQSIVPAGPAVEPRRRGGSDDSGSRMQQVIQRAHREAGRQSSEQEP